MKLIKVAGATSEIWQIFIADSSSSTGAGLTGLVFNSGSLTAYYHRDTDTTATAMTLVTMTVGTFTSLGFKEIDATNMPGWYQFCPPNAAIASGAKSCAFHLKGATNMAPLPIEVQLTAVNPDSATAFVTGINSLAPPTNWNLLSIDGSGRLDLIKIAGTTQTARDIGASVLLSTGTGTGQLDFTSGVVKSNLSQILGTTLTETAGQIAAAFKQFFNIASPTSTMNTITTVTTATTATNLTNAPTAGDLTATMKASVTTAATAATPVAASVTGAVGSVTGAVGSVTAAVSVTGDLTATMKTSVKTQVTDALNVDTYAESAAVPAATTTLVAKIGWLATLARNKITQTATTQLVRNDADAATIGTATVSDDTVTAIRGKFA